MTKVGAFLKGAAIGAALGLLFAPKSGEELRKDLMKKKEEAMQRAQGYADMAKEKADNVQQVAKEASEDIQVTLKEGYDEAKGEVEKDSEPKPPKAPAPGPTNDDTVVHDPEPVPPVEPPKETKVSP